MRISKPNVIALFALIFLTALPSVNRAEDVEFPLIQSLSWFPYSEDHLLKTNDFSIALNSYYSNIYMFDPERTTVNDMELLSTILELRYGVSDSITLELYYKHGFVFGGIMDGLIENFHELFGLSEGGRKTYPRDQVLYLLKDRFSYTDGTSFNAPLILSTLFRLTESENFSLNGRLSLGIPLSDKPGFSSDKLFFSTGITAVYKASPWTFSATGFLSFYKDPIWLQEVDITNRIFWFKCDIFFKRLNLGFLYRSSPFNDGDLSHAAKLIYLKYKITKYLEIGIIEEFPPMDTVADVTFNVRIIFK